MLDQSTTSHARLVWDPSKSDQIESTVTSLVELYRTGKLTEELRPTTLIDLGGEFLRFYSAAFRRENRSEWSVSRFPEGFSDLVKEVNEKLAADGIEILNTKFEPARYRMLPQERRKVIEMLQEAWKSGVLPKEEIIQILERDFSITLTPTQRSYYFPENSQPILKEDSLAERKKFLASKIEKVKADLNLDLSIDHFLKGMMFEQLVGLFLSAHYQGVKLQRQRQFPVAYRDLSGQPHASVFTDFLLDSSIVEVKWRNSFENIVNSIIPQLYAFEQAFGFGGRITVVYRHPCPLMRVAYDSNIRLGEEVEAMGLQGVNDLARPLKEVLAYISVEDLFARNLELGPKFMELLGHIDEVADRGNTAELRQVTEVLARMSTDIDQLPKRMGVLMERLTRREPFTDSQLKRYFGEFPMLDGAEIVSHERRMKIMERQISATRERLLLDLHELASGRKSTELGEVEITFLEDLAHNEPQRFSDLALELLAKRELRHLDRLAKRRDEYRDESAVVDAFDRVLTRQRNDRVITLQEKHDAWEKRIGAYLEKVDRAFRAYHGLKDIAGGPHEHALKRHMEWARNDRSKVRELIETLHLMAPTFHELRARIGDFVHRDFPLTLKRFYEAMASHGPYALEKFDALSDLTQEQIDILREDIDTLAQELLENPLLRSSVEFSEKKAKGGALYDTWAHEATQGELMLSHDRLLLEGIEHCLALIREHADDGLNYANESVRAFYSSLQPDRGEDSPIGYPAVGGFNLGLALQARSIDRLERERHGVFLQGKVLQAFNLGTLKTPEFARELLSAPHTGMIRSYARLASKSPTVDAKIAPPRLYLDSFFDRLAETLNPGEKKLPPFSLNADLIEQEVFRIRSEMFERTGEIILAAYSGVNLEKIAAERDSAGIPVPLPVSIRMPRRFGPHFFETKIMPAAPKIIEAMERNGIIGLHMLGDYLARKVAQARAIAYFDSGLAYHFMASHCPPRDVVTTMMFEPSAMRDAVMKAQAASDEIFRGLMMSGKESF